jgi:two-component system, NtrC family, sensor kinase
VPPIGPGERAVQLPRILPDLASLQLLAQPSPSIPWSTLRADPGLLAFFLEREIPFAAHSASRIAFDDLQILAGIFADESAAWLDWRNPLIRPVVRAAFAAARFSELLAEANGQVDPAKAWTGGWLAYAGWWSVGAANPQALTDCLAARTFGDDPFGTQSRTWGKTRAEIAWRLSSAWKMPPWARVTLGRIDATPEQADQFGGDRKLQALVQIAIVLAEQADVRLFLADEFDLPAALGEMHLRTSDLNRVRERFAAGPGFDQWVNRPWTDPRTEPALADRLLGASDEPTSDAGDEPRSSVLVDLFAERVQSAKLSAVAEFAAGASHEINNPLAVISGASQYLLKQETDPDRRRSLQSIVRQTRRIHGILTELMFFARPPAPQPEWIELGRLIRESAVPQSALAAEREVEIQLAAITAPLWIDVDLRQMTTALGALIRNGVEAAPAGGWVRVATLYRPDRLEIIVEDNGAGPDERSREHMFDPFFSGRAAGRGRGLGLSAAWRLVREHGGEVHYVPDDSGPTRFVISLPPSVVVTGANRKSA